MSAAEVLAGLAAGSRPVAAAVAGQLAAWPVDTGEAGDVGAAAEIARRGERRAVKRALRLQLAAVGA